MLAHVAPCNAMRCSPATPTPTQKGNRSSQKIESKPPQVPAPLEWAAQPNLVNLAGTCMQLINCHPAVPAGECGGESTGGNLACLFAGLPVPRRRGVVVPALRCAALPQRVIALALRQRRGGKRLFRFCVRTTGPASFMRRPCHPTLLCPGRHLHSVRNTQILSPSARHHASRLEPNGFCRSREAPTTRLFEAVGSANWLPSAKLGPP